MFGYIKPFVPELKMREHELYRAVYCGLCKAMGRGTYFYSRITLSYDIVFLAIVRAALTNESFTVKPGRCGLNPFIRRPVAQNCDILKYCAEASAYLVYCKTSDDINDSRGLKKFFVRLTMPAVKKMKKRALKSGLIPQEDVTRELERLYALEKSGNASFDATAECFGNALSYIFSAGLDGTGAASAKEIGYQTGRFIYAADAADDLEDDREKGSFNPLLYGDLTDGEKLEAVKDAMCLWAQKACGEIMLEGKNTSATDIAVNIISLGMVKTADDVTTRPKKSKKKQKNT